MISGKPVKLALMAAIVTVAIAMVGIVALMLIFPDFLVQLNGSSFPDMAFLSLRQSLPAAGAGFVAPTVLPGIHNNNNISPSNPTLPSKDGAFSFNSGTPLNASTSNDIKIEDINLTTEYVNKTE